VCVYYCRHAVPRCFFLITTENTEQRDRFLYARFTADSLLKMAAILLFMLVADLTATSLAFISGDGGVLRLQGTTSLPSSQRLPVSSLRSPPILNKEDRYVSFMR
jgi:hypothetical protein